MSIPKWLICPISVSGENFNPQNTACIPAVKIFAVLELEQISSFMDGYSLIMESIRMIENKRCQNFYQVEIQIRFVVKGRLRYRWQGGKIITLKLGLVHQMRRNNERTTIHERRVHGFAGTPG